MNPSAEGVSKKAYERWAGNGRPADTGLQGGLEAEAELKALTDLAWPLAGQEPPERGRLLQAILDHAPAVVYVKDSQGRYLLVNRRYETLVQVDARQVQGRTDYDLFPPEAAHAFRANDLRVLAADAPLEFEEVVPHADGPHTYISLKFPIHGPGGSPYAVGGISTDISERQQAQRRLVAQYAVTRALADSAALRDAAPKILTAVCAGLGWDVGIFWELDRSADVLRCLAVWHAATVEVPALTRASRRVTVSRGVGLAGGVWAGGEPAWIGNGFMEVSSPRAAAAAEDGLHGACAFPLRGGGETLGVVEFFSREARDPDQDLLGMMTCIGRQVSQFIERRQAERALHAREGEFALARKIQQSRLPGAPPVLAGFEIGGAVYPAQETGGDYLDFIPMPGGCLGVAIGDACGHGISAALLMAETRAYLRAHARTDVDPGRSLRLVNRHLAEEKGDDHFVTLLLARLDPGTRSLTYSSAGHDPGYLLDTRGEVKGVLRSTGIPLGIDPAADFPNAPVLTLEPGELVFLFTDGVVEALSADRRPFGAERAVDLVRARRHEAPGDIVAAVVREVRTFSPAEPADDITALVIKRNDSPRGDP
jgi:PAS domain S-box-containing protein